MFKIAMGCDHAGYDMKEELKEKLTKEGYIINDLGTYSKDSVDYPDFGIKAGAAVAKGECDYGIIICGSGIGISISANKVKGVRAALACDEERARLARMHNNANVLAMGARFTDIDTAKKIVDAFLSTPFEGQRHEKRISKITEYENK
ncbi:MAG: ribose 5-phosphate isomerase B [Eubacteriaceae bacterium]|nr:ribose 5-phosphate isomerase B [Eubacteriaceae bacterium]